MRVHLLSHLSPHLRPLCLLDLAHIHCSLFFFILLISSYTPFHIYYPVWITINTIPSTGRPSEATNWASEYFCLISFAHYFIFRPPIRGFQCITTYFSHSYIFPDITPFICLSAVTMPKRHTKCLTRYQNASKPSPPPSKRGHPRHPEPQPSEEENTSHYLRDPSNTMLHQNYRQSRLPSRLKTPRSENTRDHAPNRSKPSDSSTSPKQDSINRWMFEELSNIRRSLNQGNLLQSGSLVLHCSSNNSDDDDDHDMKMNLTMTLWW